MLPPLLQVIALIAVGGLAMKLLKPCAASWLFALIVVAIASTQITQHKPYQGEKLARPDRIIVHNFTGNPADAHPQIPVCRPIGWHRHADPGAARGRPRAGRSDRRASGGGSAGHGAGAVRAAGQPAPQVDDIVLRGYFVSIDEGSATKRVLVGFGSGAAEIRAAVEGYQMTAQGLRLLGSGKVESGGAKLPGMALPVAVLAVTANPNGLVVGGMAKVYGEGTGSDRIEGAAERTAAEISAQLRKAAEEQGWI